MQLPDKADLFGALISNRSALLVCAGAMAADPSMRALLERDRGLLKWIVKTAPAAFWIAARDLRIEKDRVIVPGGAAAEPIWEALVEVKVTRPADFLRALLARDSGRLAWFYDTVGTMSPERMAAAFGAPPIDAQIEEARAFYGAFRSADSNWKLEEHPFLRGTTDPWIVSSQIDLARQRRRAARRAVVLGRAVRSIGDHAALGGLRAIASRRRRSRSRGWRRRSRQRRPRSGAIDSRWSASRRACSRTSRAIAPSMRWSRSAGIAAIARILLTLDRMDVTAPRVYARTVEAAQPA